MLASIEYHVSRSIDFFFFFFLLFLLLRDDSEPCMYVVMLNARTLLLSTKTIESTVKQPINPRSGVTQATAE
jgi:hypothetical protein